MTWQMNKNQWIIRAMHYNTNSLEVIGILSKLQSIWINGTSNEMHKSNLLNQDHKINMNIQSSNIKRKMIDYLNGSWKWTQVSYHMIRIIEGKENLIPYELHIVSDVTSPIIGDSNNIVISHDRDLFFLYLFLKWLWKIKVFQISNNWDLRWICSTGCLLSALRVLSGLGYRT